MEDQIVGKERESYLNLLHVAGGPGRGLGLGAAALDQYTSLKKQTNSFINIIIIVISIIVTRIAIISSIIISIMALCQHTTLQNEEGVRLSGRGVLRGPGVVVSVRRVQPRRRPSWWACAAGNKERH